MPDLSQSALSALALLACALAVVAALVAASSAYRLRRVRLQYRVLWGDGSADVATVAARQEVRVAKLAGQVQHLREQVLDLRSDVGQGLRHVAVVRYDAFGDMGGRLSFSAAIVDDAGDGLVISSIHARGESRTYAKGIVAGAGEATLTPEEQQALAEARPARPTTPPPPPDRSATPDVSATRDRLTTSDRFTTSDGVAGADGPGSGLRGGSGQAGRR